MQGRCCRSAHLRSLVRCRQPQRIDDGGGRLGLHRGIQGTTPQQAHLEEAAAEAVGRAGGGDRSESSVHRNRSQPLQCKRRQHRVRTQAAAAAG